MRRTPPIAYIDRTRAYYRALGYGPPYEWARHDPVPLAELPRPLRDCRVAVITTAAPYRPDAGDQGPAAPYNAAAKFFEVYDLPAEPVPDLRISHVAIDRDHTSARDRGTWLPLEALARAAQAGRVEAAARVYGLPTDRSQRRTVEVYAPDLRDRLRRDGVEAAVLVPNCPVCHQSAALTARVLEAAGLPTVTLACARDIVVRVGAPRVVFSDFPLGNAAGRPHDRESQDLTLALALDLLEHADRPGALVRSPLDWPGDPAWKEDYANPARLTYAELARRRAEFDRGKETAKAQRGE